MWVVRIACAVLVVLGLWVAAVCGHAADQQVRGPAASPPPQAAPPPSDAIPVAEIAAQAATTTAFLRELTSRLAPSAEVERIQRVLPEASKLIELESEGTAQMLRGQPSLAAIASQQELWEARQLQTDRWLSALTRRTSDLQAEMGRLTELQARWSRAQAFAQASKAPGPVLQQVADLLAGIAAAQAELQAQLTAALDLQSQVAREVARCSAVLAQIAQAQGQAMGGILVRDSPPIWSAEGWAEGRSVLRGRLRDVLASRREALVRYGRDPSLGWPLHLGGFLVLVGVFRAARRRAPQWTAAGQELSSATAAFWHSYSAALIVPIVVASSPTSAVPPTLRQLFEICALVPAIRLARPMLDRRMAPWLNLLALLFFVDVARQNLAGVIGFEQALLMIEMLAGIAALGYTMTRGSLYRATLQPRVDGDLSPALRWAAYLLLGAFSVALIAGPLGYMRVGRLLAAGILSSGALALMFYACVLVAKGLVAFILRVWPLQLLRMVQRHRELLERRTGMVLRWGAIAGWTVRTLDYLGLFQPVLAAGAAVLAARLERGAVRLSLGDVVEFVLVVWVAYLVSAFVRFVLEEDVFPRIRLPRGISYALSSVLNYVLIAFGFLLGLGALGLDLTKVTILAGAFGVGIGFGLQSVVNNFVSGLILLFERPIHVGDVIHIGDLSGEVRRIGIRASVVSTWQGAEIIVPNAQLITERVTNWTLSDRRRRIDLPVGVNYGAPLEQVTQLLVSVAQGHPHVMRDPAPQAFFMSFGQSAINYELRVWVEDFSQWARIHTEVAAAVYRALHGAGMYIPFPQQEVRIVGTPEAPKIFAQLTPPGAPDRGGSPERPVTGGGMRPGESR
jgi:potassium-dependent mechanosensitive channel